MSASLHRHSLKTRSNKLPVTRLAQLRGLLYRFHRLLMHVLLANFNIQNGALAQCVPWTMRSTAPCPVCTLAPCALPHPALWELWHHAQYGTLSHVYLGPHAQYRTLPRVYLAPHAQYGIWSPCPVESLTCIGVMRMDLCTQAQGVVPCAWHWLGHDTACSGAHTHMQGSVHPCTTLPELVPQDASDWDQ